MRYAWLLIFVLALFVLFASWQLFGTVPPPLAGAGATSAAFYLARRH